MPIEPQPIRLEQMTAALAMTANIFKDVCRIHDVEIPLDAAADRMLSECIVAAFLLGWAYGQTPPSDDMMTRIAAAVETFANGSLR